MRSGIRHALSVIAMVVALMSGILSLLREFLLFQYPGKFQEPPLFWSCLRTAFGISLIALWLEERSKRVKLESSGPPALSLKDEALDLSASILAFIYDRAQNEPVITASVSFAGGEAARLMKELRDHQVQAEAVAKYEKDTLGIYEFKFKRRAAKVLAALADLGISDEGSVAWSNDSSKWILPYSMFIKELGRLIGEAADKLA